MNLENIKTYEDICKIDGVDPIKSLPYPNATDSEETAVNSFAKVIRINRVLNDGWKPDWNNYEERKYYPWFDMEDYEGQSGAGFSCNYYVYGRAYSAVGSRLVYKTREIAEFAGQTFLEEYKCFMK
ncbi:MAG: hypothetical protein J7577_00965 [Sphingobacteriaceae bacterium]|nr:hypothetical protein [Sphingobacteriaceae bacterium]